MTFASWRLGARIKRFQPVGAADFVPLAADHAFKKGRIRIFDGVRAPSAAHERLNFISRLGLKGDRQLFSTEMIRTAGYLFKKSRRI